MRRRIEGEFSPMPPVNTTASNPPIAAAPGVLFNTINAGQTMTGTIHEAAIFTKPVGGAFAYTFEQVFADFLAA